MNAKICTNIEQSKKLIELEINVNTADMHWDFQQDGYVLIAAELGYYHNDSEIPCWSLTALLELMPKSISEDSCASVYKLSMWPTWKPGNWMAIYSMDYEVLKSFEASTPLDAVFEMVCWLLEQGYIKTDKV